MIGSVAFAIILAVAGVVRWGLTRGGAKDTYLNVESRPGAQVFIDDKVSGVVAPDGTLALKVTQGSHRVQVRAEGYEPVSKAVAVKAGDRLSIFAAMEPIPPQPGPSLKAEQAAVSNESLNPQKTAGAVSNEQVLYELRRAQNPIDHKFDLDLSIAIPTSQPAVQAHLQRIKSTNGPLSQNPPSPQIPVELPLARLVWSSGRDMIFSKRSAISSTSSSKEDHYEISVGCAQRGNKPGPGEADIKPSGALDLFQGDNGLVLNCHATDLDGNGTFRSYVDFAGSTAVVQISPAFWLPDGTHVPDGPMVGFHINELILSSEGRNSVILRAFRVAECPVRGVVLVLDRYMGMYRKDISRQERDSSRKAKNTSSMCFAAVMPQDALSPE